MKMIVTPCYVDSVSRVDLTLPNFFTEIYCYYMMRCKVLNKACRKDVRFIHLPSCTWRSTVAFASYIVRTFIKRHFITSPLLFAEC